MASITNGVPEFCAVFTRVPAGPQRREALRSFLLACESVVPKGIRWGVSGRTVSEPRIHSWETTRWVACIGGQLRVAYIGGQLRVGETPGSMDGVPADVAQDYMEVLQDLGLTYNSN